MWHFMIIYELILIKWMIYDKSWVLWFNHWGWNRNEIGIFSVISPKMGILYSLFTGNFLRGILYRDCSFRNIFYTCIMLTSSNWGMFHVTDPLWCESTCQRWIPLTKGQKPGTLRILWRKPEQNVEQIVNSPVIWDAITVMSRHCNINE